MFQHPLTILHNHSLATRYKFSRQTRTKTRILLIVIYREIKFFSKSEKGRGVSKELVFSIRSKSKFRSCVFTSPLTTLNLSCIQIDDVNLFTRGGFLGGESETSKERRRFENKNIGKGRAKETVNGGCDCERAHIRPR